MVIALRERAAAFFFDHVEERFLPVPLVASLLLSTMAQYYATSVVGMALYVDLNLSPQHTTLYWLYCSWVYWGSAFVGVMSDWFVVSGHRRKPLIAVGVVVSCLLWIVQWRWMSVLSFGPLVGLAMASTLAQMCISVPLNGMVVEIATCADHAIAEEPALGDAPASTAAHVQARAMVWRSTGSLIGSVVQTVVLIWVDPLAALVGAPILYLASFAAILLTKQPVQTDAQRLYASLSLSERVRGLVGALIQTCRGTCKVVGELRQRLRDARDQADADADQRRAAALPTCYRNPLIALIAILVFVFIYSATPDASVLYQQWLYDEFWFSNWFLSLNLGVGLLGSCVGCELYFRRFAHRKQEWVFAAGCLASALCYVTRVMLATGFAVNTMRIPAEAFVLVDGFVVAVLTRIAFMPVIHVASQRSPAGFEALVYELFTTASIGGSTVGTLATTKMSYDFGISSNSWSKFWLLLSVCAASKALPLVLLPLLPPRDPKADGEVSSASHAVTRRTAVETAAPEDGINVPLVVDGAASLPIST